MKLRNLMALVLAAGIPLALAANAERQRRLADRLRGPIVKAAEAGDVAAVRALLDRGADADSVTNGRFPWTPLMHAASRGRLDLCRLLLERGANPRAEDLDSFTPITLAAAEGHWEVVKLLAEHGASGVYADGHGETALGYAQEAGRDDLVPLLMPDGEPATFDP
jgi:ankyrin repeat protein